MQMWIKSPVYQTTNVIACLSQDTGLFSSCVQSNQFTIEQTMVDYTTRPAILAQYVNTYYRHNAT